MHKLSERRKTQTLKPCAIIERDEVQKGRNGRDNVRETKEKSDEGRRATVKTEKKSIGVEGRRRRDESERNKG